MPSKLDRWRADPVAFIREVLINPETGAPFELYTAEIYFLRFALTLTSDGRLPYPELLFAAPKKSGKTLLAALVTIYVIVVLAGNYGEAYLCANDLDQSVGRVFAAISRIIEASPLLRDSAKITANRIEFSTGSTITAIASDYAGAAGANPNLTVFDELWAYTSERAYRLWDEMVPPPTRRIATRLTVTYAGYSGESKLLETLYKRTIAGEVIAPSMYRSPGLLAAWHHLPVAPWQTPEWIEQMRQQLLLAAFLRQIENRFVTSESSFVSMEWWDACVDTDATPALAEPGLPVWVGIDASSKRDSTAIVVTAFGAGRVRLVWHKIFQPSPSDPLDFEATVERTLLDLRRRFWVREVRYDPWQMQAVAQRLIKAGLPMAEFSQTVSNLTEASTNLYELIKARNLSVYADDDFRLAVSRAVAIESSRGWKISKERQSHKIDCVVALAMSSLAVIQQGGPPQKIEYRGASSIAGNARAFWDRCGDDSGGTMRMRPSAKEDDRRELLARHNPRHKWDGY